MHRNNFLIYKSQQDAHVTEFILSDNCSTCFEHHYHPSSGAESELIWVCCGWRIDQYANHNTLKSVPPLPR